MSSGKREPTRDDLLEERERILKLGDAMAQALRGHVVCSGPYPCAICAELRAPLDAWTEMMDRVYRWRNDA